MSDNITTPDLAVLPEIQQQLAVRDLTSYEATCANCSLRSIYLQTTIEPCAQLARDGDYYNVLRHGRQRQQIAVFKTQYARHKEIEGTSV